MANTFEYAKSDDDQVRLSSIDWRGKKYIDLRHMWKPDGSWTPTKKGVRIPMSEIDQLIKDLEEIKRQSS